MFELGWTEMLVIAIVLIVVVGPKDLPKMLRTFGRMMGKMTSMAGDFRKQFDEAMREAELEDVKKTIDSARKLNPTSEIRKALSPMEKAAEDVRKGLEVASKPKVPAPDAGAAPAEPLKAGATAIPGETGKPAEAAAKANGAAAPAAKAEAAKPAAAKPAAKPAAKSAAAKTPAAKAAARPKVSRAKKTTGAAS